MKKRTLLLWIFIAGFLTNLIWENAQAPLYEGYDNFRQHFMYCVVASVIDGTVIVMFYLLNGLIRKNMFWVKNIVLSDIVLLFILGTIIAVVFEKLALKNQIWNYEQNMPTIFGLGLIPLMQLSVLSIISIYLVKVLASRRRKN